MATANYNVTIASGVTLEVFHASGDGGAFATFELSCESGTALVNVGGLHKRNAAGTPQEWGKVDSGSYKVYRLASNGLASVKVTGITSDVQVSWQGISRV